MFTRQEDKESKKKGKCILKEEDIPAGKVRCFISKQICDEKDTIELDYNGATVRVHKRYVRT